MATDPHRWYISEGALRPDIHGSLESNWSDSRAVLSCDGGAWNGNQFFGLATLHGAHANVIDWDVQVLAQNTVQWHHADSPTFELTADQQFIRAFYTVDFATPEPAGLALVLAMLVAGLTIGFCRWLRSTDTRMTPRKLIKELMRSGRYKRPERLR